MDTIYAEGQRRYVESLSAYARQFIDQMQKPRLDHIEGLSPAIAIEQKHSGHTPRSTVGTVTEIYDYCGFWCRAWACRTAGCDLPWARNRPMRSSQDHGSSARTKIFIMAPWDVRVGENHESLWEEMRRLGYVRVRVDGQTYPLDNPPAIDRRRKHNVEVLIDRLSIRPDARSRIAGSMENALALGKA